LNDYKPFLGEGILRKILKNTYFEHILVDRPEEKEEHESFFMEQVGKFQD
jgi:oleate hydratase